MDWGRSRYGLPVIVYHWSVGIVGLALLFYFSWKSPFPHAPLPLTAFAVFFGMHVAASFLHFQYARLNVVVTFESSFTTATLLVFGALPAVWISVTGILVGSVKRILQRRLILRKAIPLSYDVSVLVFNAGMVAAMWLAAGWIYVLLLRGPVPLDHLNLQNILSILIMFLGVSAVNHMILLGGSYAQGFDPWFFLKKAMFPAFLTEFAIVPFGLVMAISYAAMGMFAFFFLGATLLLSNAVLRNLSLIRYDLEEKLRHLTALNTVSSRVISLRSEDVVFQLLLEEVRKLFDATTVRLARCVEEGKGLVFFDAQQPVNPALTKLAATVAATGQPVLITSAKKDAPEHLKNALFRGEILSCIVVPLLANEKVHAVLCVTSKEFSAFKQEHMEMLVMIANEAALALENSRLYGALTDKILQLEHLNKELRQVDRLKTEFLANVSHELRTPLTSIKGYVEYIKKEKMGPITPSQNEGLTVAQRNILRLQRLINDLLDYTRLEFKKSPLILGLCKLEELWTEVYDQYAEQIAKKRLTLRVQIPADLPQLFVDSEKYRQVLNNLVSNAIKFTPETGTITIEARLCAHNSRFFNKENYRRSCVTDMLLPVEITVRDNGVGIPESAIPRIFERFYQVDSSNTREYGGTGLGLAIVKSILDAHGNPIHVQSVLGEGTSFTITTAAIQVSDIPAAVRPAEMQIHSEVRYLT
jgi:signal transduction histidine kinase